MFVPIGIDERNHKNNKTNDGKRKKRIISGCHYAVPSFSLKPSISNPEPRKNKPVIVPATNPCMEVNFSGNKLLMTETVKIILLISYRNFAKLSL